MIENAQSMTATEYDELFIGGRWVEPSTNHRGALTCHRRLCREGAAMTLAPTTAAAEFTERVWANQRHLAASLKHGYDFIVCGAGSSGSVLARRLAEILMSKCCCWKQADATM